MNLIVIFADRSGVTILGEIRHLAKRCPDYTGNKIFFIDLG